MALKLTSSIFQNGFGLNVSKSLQSFCGSPWRLAGSCRTLYTNEALGVDGYEKQRHRANAQFSGMADKFRTKMQEFALSDNKNMIFTEDLKNILYLVEDRPEDMTLVHQMMKKFNQQNKHLRFGNFIFGPVIMRMYHFLNQPTLAFEAFKDPELEGLFDQIITAQILCDLLLKNDLYKEVLEVLDMLCEKQIQGIKFPRNVTVLAMAAAYKMNTVESYEYVLKTFAKMKEMGAEPVRRTISYAAAIAIRQNAPQVALEILTMGKNPNYVTIRNLKVSALADLNRADDAFPFIRYSIEHDSPDDSERKASICPDVIEKLGASIERSGNKENALEFDRIMRALKEANQISTQTLEQLLFQEIARVPPREDRRRENSFGLGGQGFQRQSIDKSYRVGQSVDFRPRRNPAYDRERQSIKHKY